METSIKRGKILIVDDEPANVLLLEELLKNAGFTNLASATDPRRVLQLFLDFRPDLILMDLQMPHMNGQALIRQLGAHFAEGDHIPILVLTGDRDPNAKLQALSLSARDFVNKPFDRTEVLLRIRNLLEARFLHLAVQNQNKILEAKVSERTRELQESQVETLERLAMAAEFRDDNTSKHTRRMAEMCAVIATSMERSTEWVELIRRAAPLHDLGKIGIPDYILLKPAKLTAEEFEIMKTHTRIGARILSGSRSPHLQMAETIALTHHERWDGNGYEGLSGEAIPLEGRIVAVADVFDALTHARPYKPAWSMPAALAEMEKQSGHHFDPHVLEMFMKALPKITVAAQAIDAPEQSPESAKEWREETQQFLKEFQGQTDLQKHYSAS